MALLIGYVVNAGSIHAEPEDPNYLKLDTLQAAMSFFIVARAIRLAFSLVYSIALPRFKISFLGHALLQIISIALYMPLIWTTGQTPFWVFMSLGMAFEMFIRYATALLPMPKYVYALNQLLYLITQVLLVPSSMSSTS